MLKFFRNLKMRNKLLVLFFISGLIPMIIITTVAYMKAKNDMTEDAKDKLSLFSELKRDSINNYFEEKKTYAGILANTARVYNAVEAYNTKGKESKEWQDGYKQIDPLLNQYESTFELIGVFITDLSGKVIYCSGKQKKDLEGADLSKRQYINTSIKGEQNYSEFMYSDFIKTWFVAISTPLKKGGKGEIIGTINAFISVETIQKMVKDNAEKVGESGDIYLINAEGLLYNNTRLGDMAKDAAFKKYIKTKARDVLAPEIEARNLEFRRTLIYPDYRGIHVIGGLEIIKIGNTVLGLVDEIDVSEATVKTKSLLWFMIGIILGIIVLSIIAVRIISGMISKPIEHILEKMDKASEGDLTARGDSLTNDEIGQLTKGFNTLMEKTSEALSEIKNAAKSLEYSSNDLEKSSSNMAASSEETSSKVTVVSSAVEQMSASITQAGKTLAATSKNTVAVASAIEEMSGTIRNLAAASEEASAGVNNSIKLVGDISNRINDVSQSAVLVTKEMDDVVQSVKEVTVSINEVNKQCSNSMVITTDAGKKASETDQIIQKLNKSSKLIGKIVGVINDIADQTNMLALNATIEAAGAGEAGKGFAVVANEVKELAKKTAESTDEISQQIEDMQVNMDDAVKAVADIIKVIQEISNITNSIAVSVTEQSTNTSGISNAAVRAAERVNNITKEIEHISKNAVMVTKSSEESGKGVNEIAKSATELTKAADEVAMNTERTAVSINEITKASEETEKGTNEISRSIQEINIASNEVAKNSSLTNQSAQDLFELSKKLNQLVNQFKLDEENKIKGISKV